MAESKKNGMGLMSCVALIMGACVGSAIFSISGITISQAGPSAILSWFLAAAIFSAYGIVVTELAGLYPESGGIYMFPKYAIGGSRGSFWGFISSWGYIVSNTIAIAFSAIYFGSYLQAGFPVLGDRTSLAIIGFCVSAAILFPGGKRSQRIQNALVVVLICAMTVYCLTAFFGGHFNTGNFKGFFTSGSKGSTGFLSAIPLALVAYGGSIVIAFMAGDVRNPGKNIPRSLLLGLGAVSLIYIAIITAITGTLPLEELQKSEEARFIPLFASISVGSLKAFPYLAKVVSLCGAVALLTTVTALLRVNAEAARAMSGEKIKRNEAIVVMILICVCLCFAKGWTMEMISLGAVLNIVSMTVTCISLMKARKKVLILPMSVIAVFIVCYVPETVKSGTRIWLFTAAVYAAGLIVFFLRKRFRENQ